MQGGEEERGRWGRRIGLLGGTFDPVHNGHLGMAEFVLESLGLDSVLFIPSARPPHKGHVRVSSFEHRLAMVEIAVRNNPRLFVSDLEARRSGPSYSIDTLKELWVLLDENVELVFIIGMDAFIELSTWKNCEELTSYADLAVVARPNHPLGQIGKVVSRLGHYLLTPQGSCWSAADRPGRIYPLEMAPIPISSTDVRQKAKNHSSLAGLVPGAVAEYLMEHNLFA